MTSLRFREPLLSRNPRNVTDGFDLDTYAKASTQMREIMLEAPRAAVLLMVDQLGYLRMGAAPQVIRQGGNHAVTLINANDENLAVARMEPEAIMNWVGLATRAALVGGGRVWCSPSSDP